MRVCDNDKRRRGWPQLIRGNDISCSLSCGIGGMRNYPMHLSLIASEGIKERTPHQDLTSAGSFTTRDHYSPQHTGKVLQTVCGVCVQYFRRRILMLFLGKQNFIWTVKKVVKFWLRSINRIACNKFTQRVSGSVCKSVAFGPASSWTPKVNQPLNFIGTFPLTI